MQKSKNGNSMGGKNKDKQAKECISTPSNNLSQKQKTVDSSLCTVNVGESTLLENIKCNSKELVADDNLSSNSSNSGNRNSVWKCSSRNQKNCKSTDSKKKKRNQSGHHKPLRHQSTETDENGSDNISSSTLEREAPDGGYGWVVVGSAFFIGLLADGVTFSFGVFYSEFSDVFGESKATTAWVGSLLAAMPLLSGPIASSLTDRFGCRKVTICGGLLAALGFMLSSYATSIYMLMFTFGVITGFGLSLCYVAAVVIVAYYFERRRSLATGLSVCGGGIGTFLFAPWIEYLIREYGWRGTTLILSGAFLNLCICGALMRDLEWTKKSSKKREKILQNEHDFNTQAQQNLLLHGDVGPHSLDGSISFALKNERLYNSLPNVCPIPTIVKDQERHNSKRIRYLSNNYGDKSTRDRDYFEGDLINKKNKISNINTGTEKDMKDTMTKEQKEKDSSPYKTNIQNANSFSKIKNNECINLSNSTNLCSSPGTTVNPNLINFSKTPSNMLAKIHSNNSNSNNNISLSNSTLNPLTLERNGSSFNENNLKEESTSQQKQQAMRNYVVHHTRNWTGSHRHSLTYRGAVLSLKRYRLRPASSCPDIISVATADDKGSHEWKAVLSDIYIWLRGIFAWENLSNTRFLLFIMSNFLLYMWYDIPYVFLQESVTDYGYSKQQASFLGSTIGISNVFGNICLGYIGDKKWANSIIVYGVCISICGCATALMPYFVTVNYYALSTVCSLFGLMIAANYSLTPVILVKVVSLERFPSAYGLLLLVQGIGNLIGPPLAGLLWDWTGSWAWAFVVAGGGIFVSNFFILAPIYKHSGDDEKSESSIGHEDSEA